MLLLWSVSLSVRGAHCSRVQLRPVQFWFSFWSWWAFDVFSDGRYWWAVSLHTDWRRWGIMFVDIVGV